MNIILLLVIPCILVIIDHFWQEMGDIDNAGLFSAVLSAWVICWAGCLFVHVLYTVRTAFELAF